MSEPSPQPPRVVLITGAAGGLGSALVDEFFHQGWRVGAAWHQQPPATEREQVESFSMNVIDPDQVAAGVERVRSRWGRMDVLINNAGITSHLPLWQIPEAEWDAVVDVSLKGSMLCARAVLPIMEQQRDGHILNISSFTALTGARGQANYVAAKAGLIGLTQSLARETGASNVRVNAVLPGVLPTPMTETLNEDRVRQLAEQNVLRRLNDLAEVGRFVVFLAGMQNISGQVFQLDSRIARWT